MKTTKRFGARYGKRIKDRLQAIEQDQKKKQKCPYCRKEQVKRLGVGLFYCHKCNAKFTGKAYTITQPKVDVEPEVEKKVEAPQEPDESYDEEEPAEKTSDEDDRRVSYEENQEEGTSQDEETEDDEDHG